MKKTKTLNLQRKDWLVILPLTILFVGFLLTDLWTIYNLNALVKEPSSLAYVNQLIIRSWIWLVAVLLIMFLSLFYLVRWAIKRNQAEVEKAAKEYELEQNLAFIKEFFDQSPIGYTSVDAEGNILEMNQTELDWLGYEKGELVGKKKLTELLPARSEEELQQMSKQLIETGKLDNIEGEILCKDGTVMKILSSTKAVFDEEKNLKYFRVALLDFTENYRLKAETKKANRTLQTQLSQDLAFIKDLYEKSPIGYHSTNAAGFFVEINETLLRWLGYTRAEVINKLKIKDVVIPATHENQGTVMKILQEKGYTDSLQGVMVCKDGSHKEVISSMRAVFDEQGNYSFNRTVSMDFTEHKKMEDALKEAKELAEKSSLLKEQFVANMSHEIRTPLNAIISFSNLMESTKLTKLQQELSHNIHASSKNLLAIVNDILDFSKIEAGDLRIEKIPFSPTDLIHSIESMFSYRTEEKRLTFEVQTDEQIPETVLGDPNRLTQILINLLGNAFKFTAEGKVQLTAQLVQEEKDKVLLRFSIEDTGIGIPTNKLSAIFERFGQANTDTTRKYGGTGLGLSITKQLVELQGGYISVESQEEKGSRFIVELTYKKVAAIAGKNHLPEKETDFFKNKPFDLLVVEDNAMNRRIIELLLESWHLKADYAENGRIAVERLQQKKYDLVLMDIQMPEMDGYTATQKIRQELQLEVPIIATTAHAFSGEREKCIKYGMNDYLPKPIREQDFFAILIHYATKGTTKERTLLVFSIQDQIRKTFDWQYIRSVTRDKKEVVAEIVALVLEQSAEEMEDLSSALQAANFSAMVDAAHSMKNTVYGSGFNQSVGVVLTKLETAANQTTPDKAHITEIFKELQEYWAQATLFLEKDLLKQYQ